MQKNGNITPRPLTAEEKLNRENDIFDSFANYLCFCSKCRYLDNMTLSGSARKTRSRIFLRPAEICGGKMNLRKYSLS